MKYYFRENSGALQQAVSGPLQMQSLIDGIEVGMKKTVKGCMIILAILVVSFACSWVSSKNKLDDYVLRVQPGMQLTEARSNARKMGLKYVASSHGDEAGHFRDLVTASGVLGRYVCEIQHDGTRVIKVTQQFND